MKKFKRYSNRLNKLLLVIYSVSLIAGILHHHHYDFSEIKSISNETESRNNYLQLSFETHATCIILQNLSNLQTAVVSGISGYQFITAENIFIESYTSQFCAYQFHLNSHPLRAPPTLS